MERKNAWEKYGKKDLKNVFEFCEEYRQFISDNKTERECTDSFVKLAEQAGYRDLAKIIKNKETLKPGAKVYANNMGKSLVMFCIGTEPISDGMRILGAHIDSPRLDIKQNPLYEDEELALLDTHYYGGIKKYQWTAVPMALHGVVALTNGKKINVVIGEDPSDPVVEVSDLLIHLSGEQLEKKGAKVVEGEDLNLLVGSMPWAREKRTRTQGKRPKGIF